MEIDREYICIKLYEDVEEGGDGIELETFRGDYVGIQLDLSASKGGSIIKIEHRLISAKDLKYIRLQIVCF